MLFGHSSPERSYFKNIIIITITDFFVCLFQRLLVPIKLQLRTQYFPAATVACGDPVGLRAVTSRVCFLFTTLRAGNTGTPPVFLRSDFPCSTKELC